MILSVDMDWGLLRDKEWITILILFLALVGAGTLYLVAYAWSLIVTYIEPSEVKIRMLNSIYIKSNIAKYLPGNVMNLVGRNVLAAKWGFKQINIATSTLIEIIIFACTTLMLSLVFSFNKLQIMYRLVKEYINYQFLLIVCGMGIVAVGSLIFIFIKKKIDINIIKKYLEWNFLSVCIRAIILYSVFFISSGIILVIVINNVLDIPMNVELGIQIIGFYIISYFVGYITPGAPGGIGVREAVLIVLLSMLIGNELATIASIIHRFITILADALIYFINAVYMAYIDKKSIIQN